MFKGNGKRTIAGAISLLVIGFAVLIARSQQLQTIRAAQDDTLEQIEQSADQPLQVLGNDDCPLRIIEASVKEISPNRFRELTGKTVTLDTVSSVPQVTLSNTTDKTIVEFIIAVRNPASGTGRGFVQNRVAISPGEVYAVKRDHFVGREPGSIAESGNGRSTITRPRIDPAQYWIQFARRSDLYITVGRVTFDDGSVWTVREAGDAR